MSDFHEDQLANGCLLSGQNRLPATAIPTLCSVNCDYFLEVTIEARNIYPTSLKNKSDSR